MSNFLRTFSNMSGRFRMCLSLSKISEFVRAFLKLVEYLGTLSNSSVLLFLCFLCGPFLTQNHRQSYAPGESGRGGYREKRAQSTESQSVQVGAAAPQERSIVFLRRAATCTQEHGDAHRHSRLPNQMGTLFGRSSRVAT